MKESTVEIWHVTEEGTWIHCAQVTKNNERRYFTNGKLITTEVIAENGSVLEHWIGTKTDTATDMDTNE
jgi:hypothetical protein